MFLPVFVVSISALGPGAVAARHQAWPQASWQLHGTRAWPRCCSKGSRWAEDVDDVAHAEMLLEKALVP